MEQILEIIVLVAAIITIVVGGVLMGVMAWDIMREWKVNR